MTDRVLIPLPGIGTLVLDSEVYRKALAAGAELGSAPPPPPSGEPPAQKLLSDKDMEAATGIPASWFATQARERRIPFRKLGRYVRFDFAEVLASEPFLRRAVPDGQVGIGSQNRRRNASS